MVGERVKSLHIFLGSVLADTNKKCVAAFLQNLTNSATQLGSEWVSDVANNHSHGFSTLPLQFASLLGFVFTLLGVAMLVVLVGRYFIQGTTVPGFTFLASTIVIFSGAQLFALGIIGEYLARMHFRLKETPTYTVHTTTFQD